MAEYKNKTKEELIKLLEEKDESEKIRKELDSLDPEIIERDKQRLEIIIAQNKALGEYNSAKQAEIELKEHLTKVTEGASRRIDELNELLEIQNNENKQLTDQQKERLKVLIETTGAEAEFINSLKAQIEQLKEATKGVQKYTKAQKETFDKGKSAFEGLAVRIGANSRAANDFVSMMKDLGERAKKDPKVLRAAFDDVFSAQKIGLSIMSKVIEQTIQLSLAADKASAAFAAQTGAGRIMTEQIYEMAAANRNMGITAEAAGKAYQSLYEGFTGFMQLNKEGQKDLGATVAQLERIGIDGATSAKTLTLFNRNMGLSLKESQKLTKQLAMMGTEMGISSSKMVKGFVDASKTLAVYGKDSVKVFADLAAMAKQASVETSALLSIAEKFDTFSGAADTVGKLNSILGTNLSATEMLTMKENERIETLIRSVQAQGIAFKDLDKYSQRAVAAAAGISDMAQAQEIFSMSVGDFRKTLRKDPAEEAFNQAIKDTMGIVEKLTMIAKQFAITFNPLLDMIASGLQKLLDFNQALGGYFIPLIGTLTALIIFIPKFIGLFTPFIALFSKKEIPEKVGGGLKAFADKLAQASKSFIKGSLGLLAIGAAFVVLAAGVYLMAASFGGDISFGSVFGFFTGLGLGLAALAIGLYALGASFATGVGALIFAAGVAGIAAALVSIAAAIALINLEKIQALATVMEAFTGEKSTKLTYSISGDIENIADVINQNEAVLKPVLGDLALITTGKTTQSINASTTSTAFQQFSANFKNIFKPEVTVKIGEEEINSYIDNRIKLNAKEN